MKLTTLQALYLKELQDLHSAESMLLKALPKMTKAASSPELRHAIEDHLEKTRMHVDRLDQVFDQLGERPSGKKCKAMAGLLEEGKEVLEQDGNPSVLDAAIIAAAQRVEHYEMAGYGCVRTFAQLLGERQAATVLAKTLEEEKEADRKLTEIAESHINVQAHETSTDGGEEGKGNGRGRSTRVARRRS